MSEACLTVANSVVKDIAKSVAKNVSKNVVKNVSKNVVPQRMLQLLGCSRAFAGHLADLRATSGCVAWSFCWHVGTLEGLMLGHSVVML